MPVTAATCISASTPTWEYPISPQGLPRSVEVSVRRRPRASSAALQIAAATQGRQGGATFRASRAYASAKATEYGATVTSAVPKKKSQPTRVDWRK